MSSSIARSRSQSGAKYGYSTAVNYETLVDLVEQHGRRWDAAEQSPYVVYRRENCTSTFGCVTSWRQVYYDDAASMKLRYALVNDYDLRGAGMWALGYDGRRPELWNVLADKFVAPTIPTAWSCCPASRRTGSAWSSPRHQPACTRRSTSASRSAT